jgi:TctA family transporter
MNIMKKHPMTFFTLIMFTVLFIVIYIVVYLFEPEWSKKDKKITGLICVSLSAILTIMYILSRNNIGNPLIKKDIYSGNNNKMSFPDPNIALQFKS